MFRCQFSGEVSEPAVYKTLTRTEKTDDGRETKTRERTLVKAAEKPVRLVIETRPRDYVWTVKTEEGRKDFSAAGTEIVKEIVLRAKHLEAAKLRYGL